MQHDMLYDSLFSKKRRSDCMDFKLKDLGKIKKADIKLDGITVICGDNNTGKSTIGKSLFSFYNALYVFKKKKNMQYMIIRQKSVCRKIQGLRILSCRI